MLIIFCRLRHINKLNLYKMKKLASLIIIISLFSCEYDNNQETMLDRLNEVELWILDHGSHQFASFDYSDDVYNLHTLNTQLNCYIDLNSFNRPVISVIENSYYELKVLLSYTEDGYPQTLRFYSANNEYFMENIYDYDNNLSITTPMFPSETVISDLNYCD